MWIPLVVLLLCGWASAEDWNSYFKMKRTACLVASQYHSATQQSIIKRASSRFSKADKSRYINKIYSTCVQLCEEYLTRSQVTEFYTPNVKFNPAAYYYIFQNVDYEAIALDLEMTSEQTVIAKFAKRFEEDSAFKKDMLNPKSEREQHETPIVKSRGLPMPNKVKLGYLSVSILTLCAVAVFGFTQLRSKPEGQ